MDNRLVKLAEELMAYAVVTSMLKEHDARYDHASKMKQYIALCRDLGVDPDDQVLAHYNEFLDLYPNDGSQPVSQAV
jgi:hypothetical protein